VLGTTASSSSHPSRREKAGHHESDWVAYFSHSVLHIATGYRAELKAMQELMRHSTRNGGNDGIDLYFGPETS
jgi:hypothetical protein